MNWYIVLTFKDYSRVSIEVDDEETQQLAYQNMLDLRKAKYSGWSNYNKFIDLKEVIVIELLHY